VAKIVFWSQWASTPGSGVASALPDDDVVQIADENDMSPAADAEIAFCGTTSERSRLLIVAAKKLRWFHTPSAGVDRFLEIPEFRERKIVLTNNSGSYDIQIAEHVLAFIFAAGKQLHLYRDQQHASTWKDREQHELRGETVVVFGAGSIGGEVVRLASAVGMRVIAVRRTPGRPAAEHYRRPEIEALDAGPEPAEIRGLDELPWLLSQADFLVSTVPLTPSSRGFIGAAELALLPTGAVVINVSRGPIFDEDALIAALASGHIGGASLDVFRTEPLPADSPLWEMPNVMVTPHASGTHDHVSDYTTDLFLENLGRYVAGRPLVNLADRSRGY
jgi:glyoxylate/hydroxypyruvate reductase A